MHCANLTQGIASLLMKPRSFVYPSALIHKTHSLKHSLIKLLDETHSFYVNSAELFKVWVKPQSGNGHAWGRFIFISLFFVLMSGEYDELLQFPFKQRVTFSLICPTNPALSKHETFMVSSCDYSTLLVCPMSDTGHVDVLAAVVLYMLYWCYGILCASYVKIIYIIRYGVLLSN